MRILFALFVLFMSSATFAQTPPIEPGVSQELARWRAARYSDVRYKLNLTLEKMSPVLKGTMEVRVKVGAEAVTRPVGSVPSIILDWRKIKGHEENSTISNVSINGRPAVAHGQSTTPSAEAASTPPNQGGESNASVGYVYENEHLIFRDGVVAGENVIKLDFTSPILTSGSAITRYVDKEDGSEYIYSLFVPSDASTAFPVFDQPDLKARFTLQMEGPAEWKFVSNALAECSSGLSVTNAEAVPGRAGEPKQTIDPEVSKALRSLDLQKIGAGCGLSASNLNRAYAEFFETKPISTYVFAFAAGPWEKVSEPSASAGGQSADTGSTQRGRTGAGRSGQVEGSMNWPPANAGGSDIYVRKSQAAKFKPHAAEVFRLNREAVKYFEQYFDYKFPFPKYDLVLIPEFPFGGMEHAGATFLREASIIFPQEPTRNDLVSRATLIFHEAAHQWFGDTVTMRWFDDLWLKEGFATFTAYKALEKIMPEMNAWKVFYERIKQGAYQTDSTRGTTAIYQPIANLSAAKSAYGNIVYNKAPAFLRQAEFYLGEDKFQTAVRAFLKKHEFGNAGWEHLVKEFEAAANKSLDTWANVWVTKRGLPLVRSYSVLWKNDEGKLVGFPNVRQLPLVEPVFRPFDTNALLILPDGTRETIKVSFSGTARSEFDGERKIIQRPGRNPITDALAFFPNYGDYGYGIFLLDEKSRDYVLKNIQNEKDPFLRTMMWGALWDSVREGELDPRVFVELVVKVLGASASRVSTTPSAEAAATPPSQGGESEDEGTVATLLGRTGTALNYYIDPERGQDLRTRVEDLLIERMRNAPTLGQRITYYRAFLSIAASEKARGVMKDLLKRDGGAPPSRAVDHPVIRQKTADATPPLEGGEPRVEIPLKTKDRFDIVTRLLILGDPEAPRLLAELEKTETSDDAKRYAYAARAGIGTVENKAKYWDDFVSNKEISESWIEAAFGPWNSIRHSELTLPYLERALKELPNHKRNRKIFFVNGWLGAFIGGQRSAEALAIVNKFLADNPALDNDLRLKILENVDLIERAVNIRRKFPQV